jgi:hypothetical protein
MSMTLITYFTTAKGSAASHWALQIAANRGDMQRTITLAERCAR